MPPKESDLDLYGLTGFASSPQTEGGPIPLRGIDVNFSRPAPTVLTPGTTMPELRGDPDLATIAAGQAPYLAKSAPTAAALPSGVRGIAASDELGSIGGMSLSNAADGGAPIAAQSLSFPNQRRGTTFLERHPTAPSMRMVEGAKRAPEASPVTPFKSYEISDDGKRVTFFGQDADQVKTTAASTVAAKDLMSKIDQVSALDAARMVVRGEEPVTAQARSVAPRMELTKPTVGVAPAAMPQMQLRQPTVGVVPTGRLELTKPAMAERAVAVKPAEATEEKRGPAASVGEPTEPFVEQAPKASGYDYDLPSVLGQVDATAATVASIDRSTSEGRMRSDLEIARTASMLQEEEAYQRQRQSEQQAREAAQFPADIQKQLLANAKREGEAQDKINAAVEEQAKSHYDKDRFFKQIGPGGGILAAISIGLGEYARIRTGGNTNAALQIINGAINRDLEAQREEYARLGDKVKDARNLYAQLRQQGVTDVQAIATMRAAALDATAAKAEELTSKSKVPQMRLAGIAAAAGIRDEYRMQDMRAKSAAFAARQSAEQKAFDNSLKERAANREDFAAETARTVAEAKLLAAQTAGETREEKEKRIKDDRTIVNPFNPDEKTEVQPREARDFRTQVGRVAGVVSDLDKIEQVMAQPPGDKANAMIASLFGNNDNYAAAKIRLKATAGSVARAFGDPSTMATMRAFDDAMGGVWTPGAAGAMRGLKSSLLESLSAKHDALTGKLRLPKAK